MHSEDSGGGSSGSSSAISTGGIQEYSRQIGLQYQKVLDESVRKLGIRWTVTSIIALAYLIRVYAHGGFYIVTYALGIYILNLLIGFLSPQIDPEMEMDQDDQPSLPLSGSDEFKPFIRRLPEFKFWYFLSLVYIIIIIVGMHLPKQLQLDSFAQCFPFWMCQCMFQS